MHLSKDGIIDKWNCKNIGIHSYQLDIIQQIGSQAYTKKFKISGNPADSQSFEFESFYEILKLSEMRQFSFCVVYVRFFVETILNPDKN